VHKKLRKYRIVKIRECLPKQNTKICFTAAHDRNCNESHELWSDICTTYVHNKMPSVNIITRCRCFLPHRLVCIPMLCTSRNRRRIETKCKMSILFRHHFMFFPMVYLIFSYDVQERGKHYSRHISHMIRYLRPKAGKRNGSGKR
jgi:hypothetical protein